ncbi:unnamed protein product, partial [Amoebophrya sp. A25]
KKSGKPSVSPGIKIGDPEWRVESRMASLQSSRNLLQGNAAQIGEYPSLTEAQLKTDLRRHDLGERFSLFQQEHYAGRGYGNAQYRNSNTLRLIPSAQSPGAMDDSAFAKALIEDDAEDGENEDEQQGGGGSCGFVADANRTVCSRATTASTCRNSGPAHNCRWVEVKDPPSGVCSGLLSSDPTCDQHGKIDQGSCESNGNCLWQVHIQEEFGACHINTASAACTGFSDRESCEGGSIPPSPGGGQRSAIQKETVCEWREEDTPKAETGGTGTSTSAGASGNNTAGGKCIVRQNTATVCAETREEKACKQLLGHACTWDSTAPKPKPGKCLYQPDSRRQRCQNSTDSLSCVGTPPPGAKDLKNYDGSDIVGSKSILGEQDWGNCRWVLRDGDAFLFDTGLADSGGASGANLVKPQVYCAARIQHTAHADLAQQEAIRKMCESKDETRCERYAACELKDERKRLCLYNEDLKTSRCGSANNAVIGIDLDDNAERKRLCESTRASVDLADDEKCVWNPNAGLCETALQQSKRQCDTRKVQAGSEAEGTTKNSDDAGLSTPVVLVEKETRHTCEARGPQCRWIPDEAAREQHARKLVLLAQSRTAGTVEQRQRVSQLLLPAFPVKSLADVDIQVRRKRTTAEACERETTIASRAYAADRSAHEQEQRLHEIQSDVDVG